MKIIIYSLIVIVNIRRIVCDLPVHCLAKDISGEWLLNKQGILSNEQQSCGHEHPDKNTDHVFNSSIKEQLVTQRKKVILQFPDLVLSPSKEVIGRWTMVYDEGFEIFLHQDNENYFAFSKYTVSSNVTPKDDDDEKSQGYQSHCQQTFLGWYRNNNKWGCFYANKVIDNNSNNNLQISNEATLKLMQNTQGMKIVQRDDLINKNNNNNNNEIGLYDKFQNNVNLYEVPHNNLLTKKQQEEQNDNIFEQDYSFIELINDVKTASPWKAKAHEQFNTKTNKQMRHLIGMTDFKQEKYIQAKTIMNNQQVIDQVFLQQKYKINFKNIIKGNLKDKEDKKQKNMHDKIINNNTISEKLLCSQFYSDGMPKCFDWRNVNGTNYDTPIKKQGDCGSCYSVAVISSVESRIRIQSKNREQPQLSVSSIISCSRYNQGCNGGYPYLVAKQGVEFGFAMESCSPYLETDTLCKKECFSDVYKLSDYGYIGKGYYGSTNEKAMMKEIYNNGPIVVALNAAPDLYYYSSGVFITNPSDLLVQGNDDERMGQWMFTNHAVVCVGWGESLHQGNIIKYWILKNSWGNEWGEDGYFRMLRGVNLGAVENQAVFANPIIKS